DSVVEITSRGKSVDVRSSSTHHFESVADILIVAASNADYAEINVPHISGAVPGIERAVAIYRAGKVELNGHVTDVTAIARGVRESGVTRAYAEQDRRVGTGLCNGAENPGRVRELNSGHIVVTL